MEHLTVMLTREYILGQNCAKIYSKACELDQHRARIIGVAEVLGTQIMVAAQIALWHDVNNNWMQEIDDKWEHTHTKTAMYVSPATKCIRFKEHCSEYFSEWYLNTHQYNNRKGQQAHISDSLSTLQLDQLQNNLDMTVHNVNTIATTQDRILRQNEANYLPSVCPSAMSTSIASTTGANSAVEQRVDTLTKMMQMLVQQQTARSTNQTHNRTQKALSGVTKE